MVDALLKEEREEITAEVAEALELEQKIKSILGRNNPYRRTSGGDPISFLSRN